MLDFSNKPFNLFCGNSIEILKQIPDNSVDSIVTDPPYGLNKEPDMAEVLRHWLAGDDYHHKGGGFMGKTWDSFVPGPAIWKECLRVLKPGGHLLAFFGSRTYDMGTLAIRLAGFEVRDQIMWLYGSGFPKSLNVAKAIESGGGRPEDIRRMTMGQDYQPSGRGRVNYDHGAASAMNGTTEQWTPVTDAAKQWQGWGTALKPAHEPICVARKPLEGTVAANVLQHGTGALNIDGCRVATDPTVDDPRLGGAGAWKTNKAAKNVYEGGYAGKEVASSALGRWPANVIHDGSDEVLSEFPQSSVTGKRSDRNKDVNAEGTTLLPQNHQSHECVDSDSAARFFYCAKTSRIDRNEGLDDPGTQFKHGATLREVENTETRGNNHPTVKPTALMNYLIRLVTPPNGVVLDPFNGSGSTGKAAMLNDFKYIGIDLSQEYIDISENRIQYAVDNKDAIIERIRGSDKLSADKQLKMTSDTVTLDKAEQATQAEQASQLNRFFDIEN